MVEAMIKNLADNYRSKNRNKTVMELTAHGIEAARAAMMVWPGEIDGQSLKKIALRLGRFEKLYGSSHDVVFMTSTALGILEDITSHIKDPERLMAINRLISALNRIHAYFDRKIDKYQVYTHAASAVQTWRLLEV
jgi:hypothetical protein